MPSSIFYRIKEAFKVFICWFICTFLVSMMYFILHTLDLWIHGKINQFDWRIAIASPNILFGCGISLATVIGLVLLSEYMKSIVRFLIGICVAGLSVVSLFFWDSILDEKPENWSNAVELIKWVVIGTVLVGSTATFAAGFPKNINVDKDNAETINDI